MKILCNGEVREASQTALAAVLEELGFGNTIVATAVNGQFVPVGQRQSFAIRAGDAIEVLAPMQGG